MVEIFRLKILQKVLNNTTKPDVLEIIDEKIDSLLELKFRSIKNAKNNSTGESEEECEDCDKKETIQKEVISLNSQ